MSDNVPGSPDRVGRAWSGSLARHRRSLLNFCLVFVPITAIFRLYHYLAVNLHFHYARFRPVDFIFGLSCYEMLCYTIFAALVLFIMYRDQEPAQP